MMAAMTAMNTPAQAEAPRRALGWAMAARIGLPVLLFAGLASPAPRADDWGGLITVSTTMGINDGRLCMGESSRGDIGCPAYAPYVSSTSGFLGIGTNAPSGSLHILNTNPVNVPTVMVGVAPIYASGTAVTSIRTESGTNRHGLLIESGQTAAQTVTGLTVYSRTGGLTAGDVVRFSANSTSANLSLLTVNSGDNGTGNGGDVRFTVKASGHVGIGKSNPATALEVSGTLRIANGNENCDANRLGAIKYENNDFYLCRNGTVWESLASIGSGGTPDRLISGTTQAIAYQNTSLSLVTAGTERMVIGTGGNIGIGSQPTTSKMTVYTSNSAFDGVSVRNASNGEAALAGIVLMADTGSGALNYYSSNFNAGIWAQPNTLELAGYVNTEAVQLRSSGPNSYIRFMPASNAERMRIVSTGYVGIGTATPTTKLEVTGTVSATALQLADNPSKPCNAANKGMAKVVDGRIYVCRYP